MTTEYHDNAEEDSSTFWNSEPRTVSFSGVSRFRRWLYPTLVATVILVLIIALGASNSRTSNRLWSLEKSVSNLTGSLNNAEQLSQDATKDVNRLRFAVENNKDELSSVSEALRQLSTLDMLSKTVEKLKCSFERFMKNSSNVDGCCPLEWDTFEDTCYLFSKTSLNWHAARDWCNAKEAHLVILTTDKEWDFVTTRSTGTFFWVGLNDEKGEWEWVNQTPYIMNRRRWRPGQPDSWIHHGLGPEDEDCAHLHSDGRLNDLHCTTRLRFICQMHSKRS
ncbi:hypothetical protein JOB18_021858 [Solea senegalensis]|uniref:C-type lectin domain-containing protein n=1 Tax=Solea senegalensis TaxID=28829 RepID=A0AAV6QWY3_SOLSE|nr:C-type lectin domain family 10 member A-like [Solea senegalensis]KAG7496606.1 hypothetical protein JOB18_021858 [Solea senegalensis]